MESDAGAAPPRLMELIYRNMYRNKVLGVIIYYVLTRSKLVNIRKDSNIVILKLY